MTPQGLVMAYTQLSNDRRRACADGEDFKSMFASEEDFLSSQSQTRDTGSAPGRSYQSATHTRQADGGEQSAFRMIGQTNVAALRTQQVACNRQAQAGAAGVAVAR